MKLFIALLTISFWFLPTQSVAGSHQEFLKKKALIFDGWQDEGVLVVEKELPKFKRMSTAELHRRVADKLAMDERCQLRNVANDEVLDEECENAQKEW